MIGKFNLPDNGIPIRVGDSGFIYEDVYHPIEWYGGEPYRPRVETLVLNKTCDRVFMDRGEGNHYRIPGGSIDPDSTYDKQAENETNEEALIRVTNVFFTGVVYHQPMDRDYLAKGGDGCVPYVGSTNLVYTAIYAGTIDKSTIEEKDLDDHMAKNGKFYEISSVIDILRVGHIQALINSERIRDKKILSLLYDKLNELTMKEPMSTVFESRSTEAAEMETKYIYHGSTYDIDVFHPMSLDLGNAEQGPGWSTFCFYNFDLARKFALMRLIQKYLGDSKDSKRKCNWDLKRSMPYLHHSVYAEVLNGIENEKFYVYTIDATPLNLGVGNDERFPEVTFREDGVIPYKKTVCYTDEDSVRQDIEIISEDPDAFEKKQMDQIENLNRGWKTCMLNRDYSGDSAVAKLTKAVSNGNLKPGDDVSAYMGEHGISLKDISFLERLHDTKAVQEAFDVSDNFEDTILLGDHRVLHASEWKWIDGVEVPEKCYCEDGLYLPATIPDDSRIIHRGFLYEIQEGGTLAFMGQYEITLWDEERIPKPVYFLRMFVCKPYRRLGIGSVIAGYVTRYQKEEKIDELIVKVANSIWGITGIRNWLKTFTNCGVVHMDDSVIVRVDKVNGVTTESCEQNLSNLSWYHAEMARGGFNPKNAGGWDEELYSKDIDHALKQAFMSAVASNKELLKEKKFTLHMYTAGEELSAIYLGKVTMYYYGLEDNGYMPKFDWEWAEQEDFSDAFLSNLREEVHPTLEQTTSYKPGKRLSLSKFKAVRANYNIISKYKDGTSALKWIESNNVSDGCVWLDSDGRFVGACTVAKGLLDKFNEITAIEVSNEYKCHGLGRQILDYAVKTLKGNVLMVEYDNIPALSLYKQYGFKISTGSKKDVDSGLRHSYFMYLPSRISPEDKKFADEVRIGPDPAIVETVEDANEDAVVCEGMADSFLSPIFIVCTFTGTRFGKAVTKIQHCKFSHSGLSLDSDLKRIYTFNTHSKKVGGAGIESIDEYDNVSTGEPGDICVMCFFVPLSVKESVKQVVDRIFSNVDKTRYAFGNLLNILANRAVDTKDSLKMVCSQFVDYCLKAANIDLTNKSSNLVSPNDFVNVPKKNPKVFVLFDGKKSEYNSKKADGKIHRLLRTREPEELSVVAEGLSLLEFSARPVSKTLKLYYGSTKQGLMYIDPRQESFNDVVGKRDLVYVSDDPRFAACFAVKWHDDVARQGSWDNWNTVTFGISDKVNLNRPCSMYELENDGTFIQVKTKEFIADHPIKVKKETKYRTGREMLREFGVEVITLDEYNRRLNRTMESLDSNDAMYESTLPHRYFYHLVPKGANLSKGITTLQYQYDSGDISSFRKNAEKYRERLCSQWGIYNKSPKALTDKEIIQGINQFRGDDDGANRIYLFLYPPYMDMGPEMKKVLQGKDIYRIDLNDPIARRYIDSIDWGYEESNTAKRALTIFDYNMAPEEYFSDYTERDDRLLFSHMNHIAVIPKNGYIPKQCWERVNVPNQIGDILTESLCPVQENVIFNKDNIVYNIDKFESGKNNILLVTGLSGSGKSTIAEEYARKYKAEWIELDIFEQCHGFTDQSLKEAGEVFYDYLSSHKSLWEKLKSKSIKGKELGEEINKFVHYCFAWCKSRKDTKWVIEGVQIYSFLTADEVKGFPLIIMGTSMKNSILQRFKRNGDGEIEWGKELKNEFPNLIQWYWGEEKYLKSFEKEVKHVSEFTLPDGFTLPEQGDFEQYINSVELEDARNAIPDEVMEGWLAALMEADKDSNGLPSLGKDDKTGDYSADAEKSVEQDAETPTGTNNEPTEDEGDDSTDYTEDADNDDDTETEDAEDDAGGEVDGPDDTGTDYTDDAGADGSAEGESTDTQPEQQTDTQSGNNGVKNCTLLTDFESLYRLASEISETIEPIIMEKPIQNKVLTQVRSNLSAIKASIMQFITLHFKADDYAFNLYYYEIFIGLLSKNLEMLEKNRQFSSSSKTNGKKDKE